MLSWVLYCSCCAILATLANCDSPSSVRPLIIALPIRIQASRSSRHVIPEDTGQEESEEEQQRGQRLVTRNFNPQIESHFDPHLESRFKSQIESHFNSQMEPHFNPQMESTFNPQMESRFPQRPEENSNQNRHNHQRPQPFLTWNPGSKLMVLQINDVINFRKEDESGSEENERTPNEEHPPKPRQNWAYQGSFDFEDSGRINSKRYNDDPNPRIPTTKNRKNSKLTSTEDSGDDVYGTDPVIHYLRSKGRKNDKHFDFSEMPDENDDEFNIREWWRY